MIRVTVITIVAKVTTKTTLWKNECLDEGSRADLARRCIAVKRIGHTEQALQPSVFIATLAHAQHNSKVKRNTLNLGFLAKLAKRIHEHRIGIYWAANKRCFRI